MYHAMACLTVPKLSYSEVSQVRSLHACWTRMLYNDRLETIDNSQSIRYILVKSTCQFLRFSLCCTRRASLRIQSFLIAHRRSRIVPAEGSIKRRLYSQATHEWLRQPKSVFFPYKHPLHPFLEVRGYHIPAVTAKLTCPTTVVQRDRTKQDFKT